LGKTVISCRYSEMAGSVHRSGTESSLDSPLEERVRCELGHRAAPFQVNVAMAVAMTRFKAATSIA
jgi:hypothetical protein